MSVDLIWIAIGINLTDRWDYIFCIASIAWAGIKLGLIIDFTIACKNLHLLQDFWQFGH